MQRASWLLALSLAAVLAGCGGTTRSWRGTTMTPAACRSSAALQVALHPGNPSAWVVPYSVATARCSALARAARERHDVIATAPR